MMNAYNVLYLDNAMKNMGEAIDYAANGCRMNMDDFMELFISSGFATRFGRGEPKIVAGTSGTELAIEVLHTSGILGDIPEPITSYDYSPEYWCGWALALYQWTTGYAYRDIHNHISMEEIEGLYGTLHEASEEKIVDVLNKAFHRKSQQTRLQYYRKLAGYSQRELAQLSGVHLRNIQQYEQRVKNINKAAGVSLLALSRTLGCEVEDLIE